MNSIETTGANKLKSLVESQALIDVIAQALQVTESSMTLVTVINIFLDTKFLQQQHTTDTKQNLLLQTIFPIATIEGVGNGLVEVRVHFIVSIQQIELNTTNVNTPNISVNLIVVIRYIDHQRIAILIELTLDGQ